MLELLKMPIETVRRGVAQCLYPVVFMDEICKRRVRIVKHTLDVADMCGLSFYVSRCKYDGQKVQYDEH